MTLLYLVFRSDYDFAGLDIPEEEHFLRCKGNHKYRYVAFEDFASRNLVHRRLIPCFRVLGGFTHVDLPDIKDLAITNETLLEVDFHGRPEDVISLKLMLGKVKTYDMSDDLPPHHTTPSAPPGPP